MEADSDYLVRNPKLIASHLTDLYKNRCIISAHFGEDNTGFLTAITEFTPKNNILILDGAPSAELNTQLLNSPRVTFRTQLDGIKVSFNAKNIKKIVSGDQVCFQMALPNAIFWLQRRQFYRVKIPLSHAGSICEMSNGKTVAELINLLDDSINLKIADLSITGFAILNPFSEYNNLFIENKAFNGCNMYLDDGGSGIISFVVKEVTDAKVSFTNSEQRVGCLFTSITPAFESSVQRYMQDIERQKRKMLGN